MRTLTAAMQTHVAQEVTTLCTLWKITRKDGVVLGFTDHDEDVVYGGVTYYASAGYTRSAIANTADFAVDNLDVEGILESERITEADLAGRKYDGAEISIYLVNWRDLSMGAIYMRRGWIGNITMRPGFGYTAELRGMMDALEHTFIETYSPDCRAELGDARCGVNLAALKQSGVVTQVVDDHNVVVTGLNGATGYFDCGYVTWTSGNTGLSMDVAVWDNATSKLTLMLAMPNAIQVGDTFDIYPGCDKSLETCRTKYSNVINMRAEPYVPGNDKALEYPDAK